VYTSWNSSSDYKDKSQLAACFDDLATNFEKAKVGRTSRVEALHHALLSEQATATARQRLSCESASEPLLVADTVSKTRGVCGAATILWLHHACALQCYLNDISIRRTVVAGAAPPPPNAAAGARAYAKPTHKNMLSCALVIHSSSHGCSCRCEAGVKLHQRPHATLSLVFAFKLNYPEPRCDMQLLCLSTALQPLQR
jgi:hypothetical protein